MSGFISYLKHFSADLYNNPQFIYFYINQTPCILLKRRSIFILTADIRHDTLLDADLFPGHVVYV